MRIKLGKENTIMDGIYNNMSSSTLEAWHFKMGKLVKITYHYTLHEEMISYLGQSKCFNRMAFWENSMV